MEQNNQASPSSDNRKFMDRLKANKGRLIGIGGLALFVFLVVGPLFMTTQPAFYERFPSMRTNIDQWHSSTHTGFSCINCHIEPGVMPALSFATKQLPMFYTQLFGIAKQPTILTKPDKKVCLTCHTTTRTVSADGDLHIPHQAHVEVLKLECTYCHEKLVHSANPKGDNRPKMINCLNRCHNGKRATNQCLKCHTDKSMPESHKAPDWLQVHSQKTQEIKCGTCHGWAPDLCKGCHTKKPSTHVGNWKLQHQYRAQMLGNGCLVCHGGKTFCLKCHDQQLFNQALFQEGKQ